MKTSDLSEQKILNLIFSHLLKASKKGEIYLVGGALRNLLLNEGKTTADISDYDFALKNINPLRLVKNLARKIRNSAVVILDDERQTCRLIVKARKSGKEYTFDFSAYRGSTIKKDLSRRDITINALALDIKNASSVFAPPAAAAEKVLQPAVETRNLISKIMDPTSGINDLKKKSIRFISETNLRDDPVRILRAFRFAAELRFSITKKTLSSAQRLRREITRAPYERIRDELLKILDTPVAARTLAVLENASILEMLIPEITALKKSCRKYYFHPKGLWHHITETLKQLEEYTSDIDGNFPDSAIDLKRYLDEKISSGTRRALLKLVTILHDSAKPLCMRRVEGRIRFFGHEIMGAQIFQEVGRRLKLSRDEITFGSVLVKNHMRILQLVGNNSVTERAVYRLKNETGDHFPALCLLSLSDAASYKNLPNFVKNNNIKDVHNFAKTEIKKFFLEKKSKPLPKIIDGNMIMRHLGIPPGPMVGEILERLNEERALGKIRNTDEALAAAQKIFLKKQTAATTGRRG